MNQWNSVVGSSDCRTNIISQDDNCTVYHAANSSGHAIMTSYSVFPGIQLIFNDVNAQEYTGGLDPTILNPSVFEINHCREGRIECCAGGKFFYLSPGDLSIHRKGSADSSSYFPSGHYSGISIEINVDKTPRCLSCILDDVTVQPRLLMEQLCGQNQLFVARRDVHLEHVFSELYRIPQEVKKGYCKIKVLEILLFLSCLSTETRDMPTAYSASQVLLAKQICQYLTAHMDSRPTIDDLSRLFHVSQTQLKNCFKGVYGVSIYNFIRTQKMHRAAALLKTTDKTISEIAAMHGYDNSSKFAAAFRDTLGMTPSDYRHAAWMNSNPL